MNTGYWYAGDFFIGDKKVVSEAKTGRAMKGHVKLKLKIISFLLYNFVSGKLVLLKDVAFGCVTFSYQFVHKK